MKMKSYIHRLLQNGSIVFLMLSFSSLFAVSNYTVRCSYDENNQITKIVFNDGRTIEFTYDNNGNILRVNATGGAHDLPLIVTEPKYDPQRVGGDLRLTVNAIAYNSSTPLTYQWEKSNDGGITWEAIIGAHTNKFQKNSITKDDQGYYRCRVSDGTNSAVSRSVYVYIMDASTPNYWRDPIYIAPGIRFPIFSFEIPTMAGNFTATPRLLIGELVRPVNNRVKTFALQLLNAPTTTNPQNPLRCQWTSAFMLYNKKSFDDSYKKGLRCIDFLSLYPQQTEDAFVKIQVAGSTVQYLSRFLTLIPPQISVIRDKGDTTNVTSASAGQIILIKGKYFGTKAPNVWIEYRTPTKNSIMKMPLKVLTPYEYPNAKNEVGKSCMDVDSGESKIKVQLPSTLPSGFIKGINNIVIENGQGLATISFTVN